MKRGSHICHYIRRYQQCCLEKTPPPPELRGSKQRSLICAHTATVGWKFAKYGSAFLKLVPADAGGQWPSVMGLLCVYRQDTQQPPDLYPPDAHSFLPLV